MKDQLGREILYMRISITDRCNQRCFYCMPADLLHVPHEEILRYEEILRIAQLAVSLGVRDFRVTGGEPFVRRGAASFISELKLLPGVRTVSVTTNGVQLEENLPALQKAGVDGVNVSLDAISEDRFRAITGRNGTPGIALSAIRASVQAGIRTKVNCVLLEENESEWMDILTLAEELPVDVRFIERMPIGFAASARSFVPGSLLLEMAGSRYADLTPVCEKRGCGPARYFGSSHLRGRLGVIFACTGAFCERCNRVRLTSTGQLHLCLGQPDAADLRTPLRSGAPDAELERLLKSAIFAKPVGHTFLSAPQSTGRTMNAIGG